jgi:hypothetical protein
MIKMGFIESIMKLFPQLNSPIFTAGLVGVGLLFLWWFMRKGEGKQQMKLFYFADIERLISPLDITKLTAQNVHTEGKRFWRRAKSWLWKKGGTSFVVWLGKVGRGVTYRIEQNKRDADGKVVIEKLGSLYEGLKACLNVVEENELTPQTFTPESLTLLKKSEIFVCVDLETDPSDISPDFNEDNVVQEANTNMANLIGEKIRQSLTKEDWIRDFGLVGIGIAVTLVAQQLGLM